ncbi:Protein CBG17869 [Caenorhabditis briggsae]|uniref:Protein CBG17869 n=1 Tax=Caenorhabditis briggsae TaxID=6238 RepID=A8XRZ4_CAEBR|nr:Protein CBG17869 [Caenorhabditis briggsae]CAP35413.2 Protein CBG17869 [Caenorhabditis briggsae]
MLPTFMETCIPTQNVEQTCSACSPIYDATCQGENLPSPSMYCLTDSEVPVAYTRGFCSTCGVSDACMLSLGCPSGTAARLDTGSGDVNGNSDGSPTLLYCDESSPSWYAVIDSVTQPLSNAACRYP